MNTNDDKPPPTNSSVEKHEGAVRDAAHENARWAAVIMAAGEGSRMKSALPKVAHELAGRPIVRHVVEAVRGAGIANCIVVIGPDAGADIVRTAAGEGVRFAVQKQRLGTGDAVASARDVAGDAEYVLIMNGDVPLVFPETISRLMAAVERAGCRDAATPDVALITAEVAIEAYGFLELTGNRVTSIIETKDTDEIDRGAVADINSGQYAVRADWLWSHLPLIEPAANGERYLTQLAAMAYAEGNPALAVRASDPNEVRGINDRVQLAEAAASMRNRICREHMLAGVTIVDPPSTFIDSAVRIGVDTKLEAGTRLRGATNIGSGCVLGPMTDVRDSTIGDGCVARYSVIEESTLESQVEVGPYSHVRPGSYICEGVHIGNYAEVKASRLGARTRMGHFSYIGDAEVGTDVNIGAGTITANYDGTAKHRTQIGDGAFIGSDTMLVAPVVVGAGAATSAGSVVTRDVPDGMIAIGSPARLRSRESREKEPGAGH